MNEDEDVGETPDDEVEEELVGGEVPQPLPDDPSIVPLGSDDRPSPPEV